MTLHTITLDLPRILPQNTDCDCCIAHLVDLLRERAGVAAARLDAVALVLEVDLGVVAEAEAERLAREDGMRVMQRYDHPVFAVEGMDCADCARTLERALTQQAGVHYALVNFAAARLRLEYDREQTSTAAISALARGLGYAINRERAPAGSTENREPKNKEQRTKNKEQTNNGQRTTDNGQRTTDNLQSESVFACSVEGMCCAAEAGPIDLAVRALPGVRQVVADTVLARLTVTYDPQALAATQIAQQVERLGFRVIAPTTDHRPTPALSGGEGTNDDSPHPLPFVLRLSSFVRDRPRDVLTALCGLLLLAAWLGGLFGAPVGLTTGAYILATLAGGLFVARSGWATLRATRVLDINVLMTIAAAGALLIGEYAEGAVVVFLFAIGNALEGYTMERARRSIRKLMRLAPATALVLRDGVERELPVGAVAAGEVIVVRPGDQVPLDSVVLTGQSAVDQAPITGESVPVAKEAGAELFAGSINGEGALEARVTRPAQDSTLARIIHLVEQAQSQKARAQRFIDVFAKYYTPMVIALAVLVALVPPLVAGGDWATWLYRALVLLVIACPCALVISTPVSIVSAISAAARAGVLFKGGAALEAAGGLRAIAFDKTGTLTTGRPVVTDVISFDQRPTTNDQRSTTPQANLQAVILSSCHLVVLSSKEEYLLRMAAAVERRSTHPLARAIVAAAEERGLAIPTATGFQARGGRGATALVDGREVTIGNRAMFEGWPLPAAVEARLVALEQDGRTAMPVGWDQQLRGLIAVTDQERAESRATVAALRRQGVARVAMLTGDSALVAARVAAATGVDEVRAGLLPGQKLGAIVDLLARHGSTGMVGDGINDAPALARATVGIAMGAGSDAALSTADVTLMANDLGKLPFAIRLSRGARRVIAQNIAFALAVKAIFLAATLLGVATLWMAVFADTGAALIVIANGMRLLRYRP